MANVPACDVCGKVADLTALPPDIQPCCFSTAVADYDVTLCDTCRTTKTLREILEHAQSRPGGTVEGAERVPFLVVPS